MTNSRNNASISHNPCKSPCHAQMQAAKRFNRSRSALGLLLHTAREAAEVSAAPVWTLQISQTLGDDSLKIGQFGSRRICHGCML